MDNKNLFNRKNKEQLIRDIKEENSNRIICSFYKYTDIANPNEIRDRLYKLFNDNYILGRIYIASEGINAQISVNESRWNTFRSILNNFHFLKNISLKYALENSNDSFIKLTIKVKNKIVADGLNNLKINFTNVGKYLSAKEFSFLPNEQ